MRCATVLAAALVCVAAEARAQTSEPELLVKQGLELRREHRDGEALDTFRRAYAAAPTPRVRVQIAFAEQALGRWVDAEADLQKALASADDAWIAAEPAPARARPREHRRAPRLGRGGGRRQSDSSS